MSKDPNHLTWENVGSAGSKVLAEVNGNSALIGGDPQGVLAHWSSFTKITLL